MRFPLSRRWLDGATLLFGVLLFWLFARQVDWAAGFALLGHVGPLRFLLYLAANGAIALLFANRWWLLLRGMGVHLPFGRVAVYRMISATVSLLTPGPQFGGEPVQVYLLVRRSQVSPATAIAGVALDRLLELAVNLAFLIVGIFYTLWSGVLGVALGGHLFFWTLVPLALPPLLLFGFWWRGRLLTSAAHFLLAYMPDRWRHPATGRLVAALGEGEARIHTTLRSNPLLIAVGALISVGNWGVLLLEFWLATYLIGLQLDIAQFIGFVVAARLAILLPIPAGLGALEASQILAAQRLGLNPALGLALVLLFRVRDVVLALVGLWLAWRETNKGGAPAYAPSSTAFVPPGPPYRPRKSTGWPR